MLIKIPKLFFYNKDKIISDIFKILYKQKVDLFLFTTIVIKLNNVFAVSKQL